ncbi:MAG: potassium channel family protein [Mangrovibacterium sp.]
MKFIIIGLGYFGAKLASLLTSQGHEVIGIDNCPERVDALKDQVSIVLEMNTTTEAAVRSLPLDDVDAVVVAIGEDVASSILTLAILNNLHVPRIIGRAISPIHQDILVQMGVKEIVHPEEETASSVCSILQLNNAVKVTEIDREHLVAELLIPEKYIGHNLDSIGVEERFGLKLIGVRVVSKSDNQKFTRNRDSLVDFNFNPELPLTEGDSLLVAGKLKRIKEFLGD